MAAGLRRGDFSARELATAHLDRIEATDKPLHAWVWWDRDATLSQADAADARLKAGGDLPPLLGVPVGLKDLVLTRGERATAGSRILDGYVSPYDAHIAQNLKAAGAVLPGKTNMDEFAMGSSTEFSAWGPTANPWDLDRVPGGSSGGSAAAVAAYQVPLSIGTDTGGSIRQPAALCGIVGLKPTYGRVSRYGIVAFASSLDQIGPFGRDVRDTALLMSVIAGRDERDSTSAPVPVPDYAAQLPESDDEAAASLRGVRLGLPKQYFVKGMEPGVEARIREAVATLEAAGAELIDIDLPHTDYGLATYYIVAPAEASANLARYDGVRYGRRATAGVRDLKTMYARTREEGFGAEVKRRIMLGTYVLSSGYYDAYYLKAQRVRTLILRDYDRAFEQVDAVVMPTSPTPAFRIGERSDDPLQMYLADVFTVSANLAGLPAVSVPCGFTAAGLPIGLQLTGRRFDEATLFRLAHAYEQQTEWWTRQPPNA